MQRRLATIVLVGLVALLTGTAATAQTKEGQLVPLKIVGPVKVFGPKATRVRNTVRRTLRAAGYTVVSKPSPDSLGEIRVETARRGKRWLLIITVPSLTGDSEGFVRTIRARRRAALFKAIPKRLLGKLRPVLEARAQERVAAAWSELELDEAMAQTLAKTSTPTAKPVEEKKETVAKVKNFIQGATDEVVETYEGSQLMRRETTAVRRVGEIVIDGKADEEAWKRVPPTPGGFQQQPAVGEEQTGSWSFRVVYDDKYLYFFADVRDDPSQVTGTLNRETYNLLSKLERSDWIMLTIDPKGSRRRAYWLATNPKNTRVDALMIGDRGFDSAIDLVWTSEARITKTGWQVEFRIPFSQLNVTGGAQTPWGLQVERRVKRKQEYSVWSPFTLQSFRFVSGAGTLHFNGDTLKRATNVQLAPYIIGGANITPSVPDEDPVNESRELEADAGFDFRFGLSENSQVLGSFNPNFGQVEADPSQVNLTAEQLFFEERRTLFSRIAGDFTFPIGDEEGFERLFYSRRIGARNFLTFPRSPYVDAPLQTRVWGAVQASARYGQHTKVGLLSSLTAKERAQFQNEMGEIDEQVVEPMTLFNVFQTTSNFNNGNSDLRFMGTHVFRFLEGTDIDLLHEQAMAGALRYDHRFGGSNITVGGVYSGSYVKGSETAIAITQTNNVHNFQRPDADHVNFDPTRTHLGGHSFHAYVEKTGKQRIRFNVKGTSPFYDVNDAGFFNFADSLSASLAAFDNRFLPRTSFLQRRIIFGSLVANSDWSPQLLDVQGNLSAQLITRSNWLIAPQVTYVEGLRDTRLLRGGPSIHGERSIVGNLQVRSDNRKAVAMNLVFHPVYRPSSGSSSYRTSLAARFDVRDNFELSMTPEWRHDRENVQYVQLVQDAMGEEHFVFGSIKRDDLRLTLRAEYVFTPNAFLSFYAQPFVSRVRYLSFREPVDYDTSSYDARYNELDTLTTAAAGYELDANQDGVADFAVGNRNQFRADLNATLVFKWQFRIGSFFYLIWNHRHVDVNRGLLPDDDGLSLGSNLGNVFSREGAHVVLAKLSYWLDI